MEPGVSPLAAVTAQRLCERRQVEPSIGVFGKNADACEGAQHAIEHVALHARLLSEVLRTPRSFRKQIGDPKFSRDKDCLSRPVSPNQLIHLNLEIRLCHLLLSAASFLLLPAVEKLVDARYSNEGNAGTGNGGKVFF